MLSKVNHCKRKLTVNDQLSARAAYLKINFLRGLLFEPGLIEPGRLLKKDYSEGALIWAGAANRAGALNWSFTVFANGRWQLLTSKRMVSCFILISRFSNLKYLSSTFFRGQKKSPFLFSLQSLSQ